jgi:hypothetical protein
MYFIFHTNDDGECSFKACSTLEEVPKYLEDIGASGSMAASEIDGDLMYWYADKAVVIEGRLLEWVSLS